MNDSNNFLVVRSIPQGWAEVMFDWLYIGRCGHCNTEYAAMTAESLEEKIFRCTTGASGLLERQDDGSLLSRAEV